MRVPDTPAVRESQVRMAANEGGCLCMNIHGSRVPDVRIITQSACACAQTSEKEMLQKEGGGRAGAAASASEEVLYKIDIPANRYDMLCLEGIARALNIFARRLPGVAYRLADMTGARPVCCMHDGAPLRTMFKVNRYCSMAVVDECTCSGLEHKLERTLGVSHALHSALCREGDAALDSEAGDRAGAAVRHSRCAAGGHLRRSALRQLHRPAGAATIISLRRKGAYGIWSRIEF